ncbi:hypothetical protein NBT05_06380 [Aquimarina sp. ERC-38]|uniref:fibronectin type III domain-containing protein n=1 Tax=Aquimarina sp. ERC-38 TaxID=2949996 RepID=UPI002245ACFA|nr:hypothetical protein [Aquimarina sp. ERC-38]UZO82095.1 hypothetical protein NBT05_06380 [Aquimarina sp. ERC-38]
MYKSFLVIILLCFAKIGFSQDAAIQVLSRPQKDRILLRWAVNNPLAWKKANQYGFIIERITISRNENPVIPKEIEILTPNALVPQPLPTWETIAQEDQNAAVIAQALYGDSFSVETMNAMESMIAANEELERRFTFSLLAAEQSFKAALLAGWGFIDTTVRNGEKYAYRITVPLPSDEGLTIREGTIFSGLDFYEELPKPIGLAADFGDQHVLLSWNYDILKKTYNSYYVERSSDNQNFTRLTGSPMYNAQQAKDAKDVALFYSDSIPNDKTYYYRVIGLTSFGEVGPASNSIQGTAKKALNFVPFITSKEIPDANTVILAWDFSEEGNELITGFELRQGKTDEGPFTVVRSNIAPNLRKVTYTGLHRTNYFKIVAMGKAGINSESFTTLIQPEDNEPPQPPVGMTATINTLGVVQLLWQKNSEPDLLGYRIYRANNPEAEFSQITQKEVRNNSFTDTIAINSTNKYIYYKLKAEDLRYNSSGFSKILKIQKPDNTPPSPPVITSYKVQENEVFLSWVASTSDDVTNHLVYRKNLTKSAKVWELVAKMVPEATTYKDAKIKSNHKYVYTIVARDQSGLESSPANPVTIVTEQKAIKKDAIKLNAVANREIRFIKVSWKVTGNEVTTCRLYKSEAGEKLKLYQVFDQKVNTYQDINIEAGSEYQYGLQVLTKGGVPSGIKKINVIY